MDFSLGLAASTRKRPTMEAIAATADLISDDLRDVVGGQPRDVITGEINHRQLTEVLGTTLEEAIKLRSSCCFLLVAIDDLNRINEVRGLDIGEVVIGAVGKRIRAQL